MPENLVFKIFGFTEQEILSKLEEFRISPLLVEVVARDAKVVLNCEERDSEMFSYRMYSLFRGAVYSDREESLAQVLLERLRFYGRTLSVAESLTGGMITNELVKVPGCSECLMEGAVTYSNEAKIARLGVNPSTLSAFGAVSKQVASQMAQGLMRTGVDYALATTGIAGPTGGTPEKPVGLVYIAVADEINCNVTECRFEGTREEIRMLSANTALFLLWKKVVKPIDFENMVIE